MRINEARLIQNIEKNNWWFKTRNEFIKFFIKKCNIKKDKIILNIGCGTNYLASYLQDYKIYGVDNNLDLNVYQNPNKLIIAEATKLPFKNSCTSTILLFDVMEHIENDLNLIKELNRILIKGGNLLLSVPAFNFLWSFDDMLAKHYKRYNIATLKRLVQHHFYINKACYWNFLIFLPLIFSKLIERVKKQPQLTRINNIDLIYSRHFVKENNILNRILYIVLKIENSFIKRGLQFPFGVSIFINLIKK